MIQITVNRSTHIHEIIVEGHADSGPYGHDLVCAIVSGITTGLANALYEMIGEENITLKEGYAHIVISQASEYSDTIVQTAIYMYYTVQETNKNYIRIMEV